MAVALRCVLAGAGYTRVVIARPTGSRDIAPSHTGGSQLIDEAILHMGIIEMRIHREGMGPTTRYRTESMR